ncbi:MAG: Mercuric reductase [Verrucomicrobia subdivision 3 bacterium]|nr:Mercuric reductase [Limisphaerales bacterium]MCS1414970.1 Mercuric reductase [Limisphaerales bacterium]
MTKASNAGATALKSNSNLATRIVLLITVLGLIGFAYTRFEDALNLTSKEQALRSYQENHAGTVVLLSLLVYIVVTGLSLPGAAVLTLVLGWLLGFGVGLLVASVASTAGATLAFLFSRFFLRDLIQSKFGEPLKTFNEALDREGAFYLFTLRLILVVPFFVINLVMGLTPIRTWTFWWVSQLGMLPGTAVYVYAGASFPSLAALAEKGVKGIISPQLLVAFTLLGLLPIIAKKLLGRFKRPANLIVHHTQPVLTQLTSTMSSFEALLPRDDHNLKLESHVRPPDYINPTPASKYNLMVIGAGTAGLVTAAGAAGLGAKVALVERALMGGDCLNVGCVPSKGIISAARVAAAVRGAGDFGVKVPPGMTIDFSQAMARMRKLRSAISPHDSVKRFSDLGIDVFLGQAEFADGNTVRVDDKILPFSKAVICSGARASAPPIPGLQDVPYLTNETLFSLTELPKRFGIIGAGPIGCEMAQTFAQFGAEVYLVGPQHEILPKEDREAAQIVSDSLKKDGVHLLGYGRDLIVSQDQQGIHLKVESPDHGYDVIVDKLLIAVGRAPNVEGMNLEKVGIEYSKKGIQINDFLQTTNPRVYAAGDICSPYQFTHAADFMARAVLRNALFHGKARHSSLVIPWCTYTSPELAHVGLTADQAAKKGIEVTTFTQPLSGVDRAILEGETEGFVRVHVRKGKDEIVGATIVASNAGDMISSFSMAMTQKIGLGAIANVIHPYPTQAEAIRKLGDRYNRTKFTPFVKNLFNKWLAWSR